MSQKTELMKELGTLEIKSSTFVNGSFIPAKYTCEGMGINPPLDIHGIPKHSKSLAIIFEDPDAPAKVWLHWLVFNIPITSHINENEIPGVQGINDFDKNDYGGPCPPSGTHRYIFKVYALDDFLDIPEGSSRKTVEQSMKDHIIAYGQLQGKYKKIKSNA